MLNAIHNALFSLSPIPSTIVSVAIMIFAGFLMTRIGKLLRLPNVSAYIIAGILIGPFVLNFIPETILDGMGFISDIALAFIAFATGEFFRFSVLKKSGAKSVIIMLLEASLASALVFFLAQAILRLNIAFSIVLAALASVSSLTSTMMTIRQTGAKGEFVTNLLQVVALDNIFSLFAYGIAISVAMMLVAGQGSVRAFDIIKPILFNLILFAVGGLFGLLMKSMISPKRSTDNRLIASVGLLFLFCSICSIVNETVSGANVSPLLGCMAMGTVYINLTDDDRLFKQLNYFSPPLLLLFFLRSGASLNMNILFSKLEAFGAVPIIVIGILYLIFRVSGKYIGSFLGCLITKRAPKIRNFMGLALIPQSSVAIGLATLAQRSFETIGTPEGDMMAAALLAIILAASVLHELIGPSLAKMALYFSGSYTDKLEELVQVEEITESGKQRPPVEVLIERIHAIQNKLPPPNIAAENEKAFTEAAEEHWEALYGNQKNRRRGSWR